MVINDTVKKSTASVKISSFSLTTVLAKRVEDAVYNRTDA
jgi:hypothetical protein